MKDKIYVKRFIDELGYVIDFSDSKSACSVFDFSYSNALYEYINRGYGKTLGIMYELVDLTDDLKPNTFDDYIEFCKFEKIKPSHATSLNLYKQCLKDDKIRAEQLPDKLLKLHDLIESLEYVKDLVSADLPYCEVL